MNLSSELLASKTIFSFFIARGQLFKLQQRLSSSGSSKTYDIALVGGGIIGVSTARLLSLKYRDFKIILLEKEKKLGVHQSGSNSGVIHSGIYYPPGSLKAKLCVEGSKKIYKYLKEKNIDYRRCGKLIVAVKNNELFRLEKLYERSLKNNVPGVEIIGPEGMTAIQPGVKGIRALWSPNTGIVDWGLVTQAFAQDFKSNGGQVKVNFEVQGFDMVEGDPPKVVISNKLSPEKIEARWVITAAGLFSDKVAQMTGSPVNPRIVPFRGEYLLLKGDKKNLIKTNIYPVPDPRLPFLGLHFTPRLDGNVWLGPNAVLATKREGYSYRDIDLRDMIDALTYPGLIKLSLKYLKEGAQEIYRSLNIDAQIKILQQYIPSIKKEDVVRGPTGVRAQALDENGNLVEDFVFDSGSGAFKDHVLHVRNAPSPGATSSLAIAEMIVQQMEKKFFK
ncbi:L-2-hydroxyglutarate dehydrogenase, mitochondrial [Tetranychus urticae]|uniref:L-2-hydroxyglutarate dehydrogenase, mitochondrial n=1 Tax=Tetranychus urticae TaxID=32264 RepID=T1KXR7_TETUR|nr:L-2-hydroxyglutarate dehydrogenase, mitochondrial [Tetranychus urticae]XP_015791546.1 L-2-hydroxyglutarate dehydrogenase, mitochondrial [Tetranychus urticae]